MARPFPRPGRRVSHAFHELDVALNGNAEQRKALGDLAQLARPWDPPSCVDSELRAELWHWLEEVVTWLNTEYLWDPTAVVPTCWPQHPHLVHEIAVLADLRRRASIALTSDLLEEWHRYALPAFVDRLAQRTRGYCDDEHQPWPARARLSKFSDEIGIRTAVFVADAAVAAEPSAAPRTAPTLRPASGAPEAGTPPSALSPPRLQLVDGITFDSTTGVIVDAN